MGSERSVMKSRLKALAGRARSGLPRVGLEILTPSQMVRPARCHSAAGPTILTLPHHMRRAGIDQSALGWLNSLASGPGRRSQPRLSWWTTWGPFPRPLAVGTAAAALDLDDRDVQVMLAISTRPGDEHLGLPYQSSPLMTLPAPSR